MVAARNSMSPATDVQKGLYYLQRLSPTSSAYNLVFSGRIEGELDAAALRRAVQVLARRHSALRQTFVEADGEILLQEHPDAQLTLSVEDARGMGAADLQAQVYEVSREPFDLLADMPLRLHVFRHDDRDSILLLVAHHASLDFWSMALVLAQLSDAYECAVAGEQVVDQSVPIQFGQYVAYLADLQETPGYKRAREKLVNGLRGAETVLNLSTDLPRGRNNPLSGRSYSFSIPSELTQRVMAATKERSVTPYMYLLSIFQLMLHRYTGQQDVLVGTPAAGRDKRKWREVVGNFVNTLVLRSQIDDDTTFERMLQDTYQRVATSVRFQSVQFPQLVEGLALKPDPARAPLIQASFAWDRLPQFAEFAHFFSRSERDDSVAWGGLRMRPFWVPQQEGQFDLALEMGAEIEGKLTATIKYRNDLFEESSVACFAGNFCQLLDSLTRDPRQNVNQVRMVNEQQEAWILHLGRSSIEIDPPADTLHGLFERQASQHPDVVAVRDVDSQISYRELNRQASRIAAILQADYNVAGKRVGICHTRSAPLLVQLLAILKAGAAYVPIDPSVPEARSRMIVEDADLALLIQDDAISHLDFSADVAVLSSQSLSAVAEAQAGRLEGLPAVDVRSDDLAYVIFTSGSTGRPKGVAVPHSCVVNLLGSFAVKPGFHRGDTLLAITTIAFDISVLELFLPITQGGETIVIEGCDSSDPRLLIARMERFRPRFVQATPSHWRMLLDAGWVGDPAMTLFSGGEALPRSIAEKLNERCAELYNLYGPTETTIWSTIEHYQGGAVSIGRPIANTRVHVVDKSGQLVPQGAVGELCIGGSGVTRGYLNQPDLTASAFVNFAFTDEVVYKTGDLARFNSKGSLECLGRIGNQVKLRGFRVELDDIEENVRGIEGIDEVVVVARDVQGEQVLVCYFVSAGCVSVSEIRDHLKYRLPAYMIPAFFQQLDALPMTPNGKIDRKQLPDPTYGDSRRELIAPRSALEADLLVLWQEVLGERSISVEDDFYDVGGHSLSAMNLLARIERHLGRALDNRFLLDHTSIAAMATAIEHGEKDDRQPLLVTLNQGDADKTPLFLMHPIGGTVYCYLALSRYMDRSQPIYALQSPGIEDADAVEVGIEEITANYVAVIQEVQPQGPVLLGGWCFGGVLAYEAARQLSALGRKVDSIYCFDTRAPIVANHPDDGDDATLLSWFARDLAVPYNKTLSISPEELRAMSPDDQFRYVLEQAKQLGVVTEDANEETLHNHFSVYIANGMALQMYGEHRLDVKLTLYFAKDEPADYGPLLGWDQLLNNEIARVDIDGEHNSIMYSPWVKQIASDLSCRLARIHEKTAENYLLAEVA